MKFINNQGRAESSHLILLAFLALVVVSAFMSWFWQNLSIILVLIFVAFSYFIFKSDRLEKKQGLMVVGVTLLLLFSLLDSGSVPSEEQAKEIASCVSGAGGFLKDGELDKHDCSGLSRGKSLFFYKPFEICGNSDDDNVCTRKGYILSESFQLGSLEDIESAFGVSVKESAFSFLPWRADTICELVKGVDISRCQTQIYGGY